MITREEVVQSLMPFEVHAAAHRLKMHEGINWTQDCNACLKRAIDGYVAATKDSEVIDDIESYTRWLEDKIIYKHHILILHDDPKDIVNWWKTEMAIRGLQKLDNARLA